MQVHPDLFFALAQSQHQRLLQEAAGVRLLCSMLRVRTVQVPSSFARWVGTRLMMLGLRWQGYYTELEEPITICCGTVCQQLSPTLNGEITQCVSTR